ncbi:hypothetical protein NN561_000657 [Cricetulus griseus]
MTPRRVRGGAGPRGWFACAGTGSARCPRRVRTPVAGQDGNNAIDIHVDWGSSVVSTVVLDEDTLGETEAGGGRAAPRSRCGTVRWGREPALTVYRAPSQSWADSIAPASVSHPGPCRHPRPAARPESRPHRRAQAQTSSTLHTCPFHTQGHPCVAFGGIPGSLNRRIR